MHNISLRSRSVENGVLRLFPWGKLSVDTIFIFFCFHVKKISSFLEAPRLMSRGLQTPLALLVVCFVFRPSSSRISNVFLSHLWQFNLHHNYCQFVLLVLHYDNVVCLYEDTDSLLNICQAFPIDQWSFQYFKQSDSFLDWEELKMLFLCHDNPCAGSILYFLNDAGYQFGDIFLFES